MRWNLAYNRTAAVKVTSSPPVPHRVHLMSPCAWFPSSFVRSVFIISATKRPFLDILVSNWGYFDRLTGVPMVEAIIPLVRKSFCGFSGGPRKGRVYRVQLLVVHRVANVRDSIPNEQNPAQRPGSMLADSLVFGCWFMTVGPHSAECHSSALPAELRPHKSVIQ